MSEPRKISALKFKTGAKPKTNNLGHPKKK